MGMYTFTDADINNMYVIRSRTARNAAGARYYYTGYKLSSSPRFMTLGHAKATFTKRHLSIHEYEITKAEITFSSVNL